MLRFLTILLTLQASVAFADPKVDLTDGKVYDCLADYAVECEEVYKTGFAFTANRESVYVSERFAKVKTNKLLFIEVHDKSGQSLLANVSDQVHGTNSPGLSSVVSHTRQILSNKGKRRYRSGNNISMSEFDFSKEKYPRGAATKKGFHYQRLFDLTLASPRFQSSETKTPAGSNSTFFLGSTLNEASYDENGDIYSEWQREADFLKHLGGHSIYRITFGKEVNWMPIFIEETFVVPGKAYMPMGHIKTTWEKIKGHHYPKEMEVVRQMPSRDEYTDKYKFEWKVGNEVKKLIKPNSEDWLEPVRVLFDGTWQGRGRVLGPVPSQLLTEEN